MENIRVLLVDDDPDHRELIAALLENANYNVDQARSADDAFEKAKTKRFDVIVTDVAMPHTNGVKLASMLNKQSETAAVPVLLITAGTELVSFTDTEFKASGICLKKNIRQLPEQIKRLMSGPSAN